MGLEYERLKGDRDGPFPKFPGLQKPLRILTVHGKIEFLTRWTGGG